MKRLFLFISILASVFSIPATAQNEVSGVYVGGHIRRERPKTIQKLRESGFTYALLFNVDVQADGTLKTDGETICQNGEYVFGKTQPHYQEDIALLKTAPTSISRIEIVIGGWGNKSYNNIKDLIKKSGTGSNTMLYKNFKALIEAVPQIDAVNNDDENCYDVETGAKFHIMMYDLGYKTSLAPYTYKSYWQDLCAKIRSSRARAVDRVMIQCYDGGAGNTNSVASWTFNGVTRRHAGLMYYSNDWSVSKNLAQFQKWADEKSAVGGFVWVYNSEEWDLNAWASGMNRIFKARTTPEDEVVLRCYSEYNYKGYCVSLPAGSYSKGELAVYGLTGNDLSSMELVKPGYKVRLYRTADFTGTFRNYSVNVARMPSGYNNGVNSLIIEELEDGVDLTPSEEPAIQARNGSIQLDHCSGQQAYIYDASGRQVYSTVVRSDAEVIDLQRFPRGTYVVRVGDRSLMLLR